MLFALPVCNKYCIPFPFIILQGGSKHDGIASILRVRHGASSFLLPETTTSPTQCTEEGKDDLIDVTARRTLPSRKSSEVAAVCLGMKRAMTTIPQSLRKQILILSDSEYALDFFCKSEYTTSFNAMVPKRRTINNKGKKKGRRLDVQSMEHRREEAHRRSLMALLNETPRGILFSKVRSSSRGVGINGSTNDGESDDIPWDGIGFIDHDAADHLSSITRSVANSYDDDDNEETKIDITNAAQPLGKEDIMWLENSDSEQSISANNDNENKKDDNSNGFWKTFETVGSEARCDRRERNKRRIDIIEDMVGPRIRWTSE